MTFRNPVSPLVVAATLAAGTSVGLAAGTAVKTDISTTANVLLDNAFLGFPSAQTFGPWYVGDFEIVQLAFQRFSTSTGSGYTVTLQWFESLPVGQQVGSVTVRTPDSTPFFDSFPIQAPYLQLVITPTAPGVSEFARVTLALRKGQPGSVGTSTGDGMLLSQQYLTIPAGTASPFASANTIVGGPASWSVYSSGTNWVAVLYGTDQSGALLMCAAMASRGGYGDTLQVMLPTKKLQAVVLNTGTVNEDFYLAVVVPARR